MTDINSLRTDYSIAALNSGDLHADPCAQFQTWLDVAIREQLPEPNAMCLATADASGVPSTRVVLLKKHSAKGLTFFTNYQSKKARELAVNNHAAVNFLWLPLQRQVNITGRVQRVSRAETLAYFITRPLNSKLGAWTSAQSSVINSRQQLEARWASMKRKFADGEVPLPDAWGGYQLVPDCYEFWQGRPGRLHDRFRYSRCAQGGWRIERLAP